MPPSSNAVAAEVEWFYEDLQDLLELTPPKDVLFIIGDWNAKVGSQEELTHWKRLWCWEGLGAEGEEDNRGWDGWMASLTQWTWVWVNSGSWWWTGRPGVLRFMGLQRVGHDWATELNWWLVGRGVRCYSHFRELRPSKLSKKGRTEAIYLLN